MESTYSLEVAIELDVSHINPIHILTPYFFNNLSQIIL
jgi:hypothetical protein